MKKQGKGAKGAGRSGGSGGAKGSKRGKGSRSSSKGGVQPGKVVKASGGAPTGTKAAPRPKTAPLPSGGGQKPARKVELGKAIAEGGEGRIHEIVGRPGFVAKVYHTPPSAEKVAKLEAMVAASTPDLLKIAAWPVELLRDRPAGPPIGIVMPHIADHEDIHLLYGPRSRLATFPNAGWPFLIRSASNLARAFAVVHAHGHVVGDVNDRVALVSRQALVRLIDCDGFQIKHGDKRFACDVGVLTHQPPELQGVSSFRGLARSRNHDGFGLAVLIFQLLFMARHPFSGSYGKAGHLTLERAIKELRFVYGRKAQRAGMAPPPASLDLSVVTRDVARLFEQAFGLEGAKGKRPTPAQWVQALDELGKLVQRCRTNPNHAYLKGRSCPFCAIDRKADMALFHLPHPAGGKRPKQTPIHMPTLWKEIAAVESPGKAELLPQELISFERQCRRSVRRRNVRFTITAGLALAAVSLALPTGGLSLALLLLLPPAWPRHETPGGSALSRRVRDLVRRWTEKASGRSFRSRLEELKKARVELQGLDEEHARAITELELQRRQHQLDAFLKKQRLAAAAIPALDKGTQAVLESYGVETADQVNEQNLAKVALGEPVRKALLDWRTRVERRFLYDPQKGVDPADREALERRIQKRRADLIQKLVDGPAKLRHTKQQIEVARKTLGAEIQPLLREIEKARVA